MKKNSMIYTLLHLKGNPRACVYTEPLWGIPFNLYIFFAPVYMVALGVTDIQIGMIASLGMVSQVLFALLGGVITDKLGRKKTTLIFDVLSWTVPCLIWAVAQNYVFFAVAAFVNGVFKVTANSWTCLLVEDADKDEIVSVFSWVYVAALGSAFFAPITGLLVKSFELIPTIRGMYLFAAVVMTSKFVILFFMSTETKQGRKRLEETKGVSLFSLLKGYGPVAVQILKTPQTLITLGIMVVMGIVSMVNTNFWAIIVTKHMMIPESQIGLFAFVKSLIMLSFYFFVVPRINALRFRRPMLMGFGLLTISQLLLIFTPEGGYVMLVISIILEAASLSLISPLLDSLQVIMVDPQERARIIAILYVIVITLTSPFGWVAGLLSDMDRRLPFVMNLVLLGLGFLLTHLATYYKEHKAVNL